MENRSMWRGTYDIHVPLFMLFIDLCAFSRVVRCHLLYFVYVYVCVVVRNYIVIAFPFQRTFSKGQLSVCAPVCLDIHSCVCDVCVCVGACGNGVVFGYENWCSRCARGMYGSEQRARRLPIVSVWERVRSGFQCVFCVVKWIFCVCVCGVCVNRLRLVIVEVDVVLSFPPLGLFRRTLTRNVDFISFSYHYALYFSCGCQYLCVQIHGSSDCDEAVRRGHLLVGVCLCVCLCDLNLSSLEPPFFWALCVSVHRLLNTLDDFLLFLFMLCCLDWWVSNGFQCVWCSFAFTK